MSDKRMLSNLFVCSKPGRQEIKAFLGYFIILKPCRIRGVYKICDYQRHLRED